MLVTLVLFFRPLCLLARLRRKECGAGLYQPRIFSMSDLPDVEFFTKTEMLSALLLRLGFFYNPPQWALDEAQASGEDYYAHQSLLLFAIYTAIVTELNRRSKL